MTDQTVHLFVHPRLPVVAIDVALADFLRHVLGHSRLAEVEVASPALAAAQHPVANLHLGHRQPGEGHRHVVPGPVTERHDGAGPHPVVRVVHPLQQEGLRSPAAGLLESGNGALARTRESECSR
ncbi:MAG: hypothetical protein HY814_03835 [Candidatus Riflebacteria bacterium]|nr:hypothetical protein [Candidatus Riflebacteria bacterium]